jgi:hypothetical protein
LVRVEETNGALEAIEEGLKLLEGLKGGETSFVQVKKM